MVLDYLLFCLVFALTKVVRPETSQIPCLGCTNLAKKANSVSDSFTTLMLINVLRYSLKAERISRLFSLQRLLGRLSVLLAGTLWQASKMKNESNR